MQYLLCSKSCFTEKYLSVFICSRSFCTEAVAAMVQFVVQSCTMDTVLMRQCGLILRRWLDVSTSSQSLSFFPSTALYGSTTATCDSSGSFKRLESMPYSIYGGETDNDEPSSRLVILYLIIVFPFVGHAVSQTSQHPV